MSPRWMFRQDHSGVDLRDGSEDYCCTHDHFGAAGNDLDDLLLRSRYPEFVSLLERQFSISIRAVTADDQTASDRSF